jgi:hypothetical protein
VRWGNVAQLAALAVAVALIAFGTPDGCGSEPKSIPLDALPGERVVRTTQHSVASRPPRVQHRRPSRLARPRRKLGRKAVDAASPVVRAPHVASPRPRRRARIPEAAREFSFDR